jgi:hypothetical protein
VTVQILKEKDRWEDTSHHQLVRKQEVFNRFPIFLNQVTKVGILSQDIAPTQINLIMVINLEATNPFQVSVIEIIDLLEESISVEPLQDLVEVSVEAREATL